APRAPCALRTYPTRRSSDLLRLRTQTRLLPAAALNEALEVRIAEYRERMQQEPPRRVKRQLKDQTRDELLPKALLKSQRTTAMRSEEHTSELQSRENLVCRL